MRIIRAWLRDTRDHDLIEYALPASLIGTAGAVALFGFDRIVNSVSVSWDNATRRSGSQNPQ